MYADYQIQDHMTVSGTITGWITNIQIEICGDAPAGNAWVGVTISYSLCTHYQRRLAAKFQFGALMTEPGKHFLQHLFSDSLLTNPSGYAIIPINQLAQLVFGERSTNRHEELLS